MDENLEQMWVATVKLASELKKRGVNSSSAFKALRDAKSILNERRLNAHSKENKAVELIESTQRELLSLSAPFGRKFASDWERRLRRIMRGKKAGSFSVPRVEFFPGMPRSNWVRFSLPRGLDEAKVKEIAKKCGVAFQRHSNCALIFGDKSAVRKVLNEVSPYFR